MQFSPEFTSGAMAIVVTIILAAISGIGTLIAIYLKTRTDISRLDINHLGLKADMAEMKGEQKAIIAALQTNSLHLERISARQELMGAISNLPNDLAAVIGKWQNKEKN